MENYNKELESNLLDMAKQKEASDRMLLTLEIVMGVMSLAILIASIIVAGIVPMKESHQALIILLSLIPLLIATPFALRIEQVAGYYKCKKCGHLHVPHYASVFGAMHLGRTRYMKCSKCGKRSWQKKVITKD